MKLSAPKQITFWIAVIVAVVGVVAYLVTSLGLSGYAVWVLVVAFIILALGNLIEGL
jgi:cytochrome c oxidase subunit IV